MYSQARNINTGVRKFDEVNIAVVEMFEAECSQALRMLP